MQNKLIRILSILLAIITVLVGDYDWFDCIVKEKVGQGQPFFKDITMQSLVVIVIILMLTAPRLY